MRNRDIDIEKLYNTCSRKLYFTSLRITANSFDAEEAMQEAFLRLYKLEDRTKIEKVENWLTSVCIHISIDLLRKRNRDGIFKQELHKDATKDDLIVEPPNYQIGLQEEPPAPHYSIEAIKESLLLLPHGYRLILSLHLFEGYDYEEIAAITGLKESSIRSQYLRARKRLAEIVKKSMNKE